MRPIEVDAIVIQRQPTTRGLVGYWSFNEGTSTRAFDYSGNRNTGTLTGGPTWVANGKLGKALSFDGSDDYVQANRTVGPSGGFSASVWVNPTSDGLYMIATQREGTDGNNSAYFQFFLNANTIIGRIFQNLGTDWIGRTTSAVMVPGSWQHVAYTWDGTTSASGIKVYRNGVQVDNANSSGGTFTAPSSVSLFTRIGVQGINPTGLGDYFNGLIDEPRIYNRALSASEISTLYKAGAVKHQNPTTRGLVGYWSFNEGTSTRAFDYSGNGNTGTLTGGPTWVANGKLGKALSFDGVDDYVDIPSGTVNTSGDFTVAAWLKKIDKGATEDNDRIFSLVTDSNNGFQLNFDDVSGKYSAVLTRGGANTIDQLTYGTFATERWVYISYVVSGSSGTFYRNGIAVSTDGTTPIANGVTAGYNIGRRSDNNSTTFFNGLIDEVRIYNRALSAGEINTLYKTSAARHRNPDTRGLVGYWSFNEGTSTRAFDYSGNGNTGTLTGGPTWVTNGKLGKALSFDGSDDYVSVTAGAAPTGSTARTVSLWVRTISSSWVNNSKTIFEYGTNTTRQAFGIDPNAFPNIEFYTWADDLTIDTGLASDTGWFYITVTYDGNTTLTAYINGVQKGTKTLGGTLNTASTEMRIGCARINPTWCFNGLIDEPRIYNRALSAAEVAALYNSGRGR